MERQMYLVRIKKDGKLVYIGHAETMLGACKVIEEFEERGCGYEAEVKRVEQTDESTGSL